MDRIENVQGVCSTGARREAVALGGERSYGRRGVAGLFVFIALLGSLWLAGCASTRAEDRQQATSAPSTEYRLGPGDQLRIHVRDNPDLSVELPVRPDGRISVPLIQDVEAAGKTPSELGSELEDRLSRYLRTPNVTVMVLEFVGAYSDQVRIVGQAVDPRALSYREGMTVLDAIIEVGGLTRFAAGNRAKLVRRTADGERSIPLRLADLIEDGDTSANVRLRPGDIIVIPEAYF